VKLNLTFTSPLKCEVHFGELMNKAKEKVKVEGGQEVRVMILQKYHQTLKRLS
jgi:autonomous glycyl radical cofactor GrcA